VIFLADVIGKIVLMGICRYIKGILNIIELCLLAASLVLVIWNVVEVAKDKPKEKMFDIDDILLIVRYLMQTVFLIVMIRRHYIHRKEIESTNIKFTPFIKSTINVQEQPLE
jgi:hypothetical protein